MDEIKFRNEQELKSHLAEYDLAGLDSEYSFRTKNLISEFGANGAHLNRWWAMTPVDWYCPSCRRRKEHIVRVNQHNYLICHLHEHHDHMKDIVKKRFETISTSKHIIVANELSERFAVKTAFSLSAYDNTIICSDCNEADKNAKLAIGAHIDFSFSPKEIGVLIIVKNNHEHEINTNKAKEIWLEAQESFDLRMNLANYLAEVAASNKNWYQPSRESSKKIKNAAKYWFRKHGLIDISNEPEKLLYNSVVFQGKQDSWRKKTKSYENKVPIESEIKHLIATRGRDAYSVDGEHQFCSIVNANSDP